MLEDSRGDMHAKAFGGGRQRMHFVRIRDHLASSGRQGIVNLLNACATDCCDWTFYLRSQGEMGVGGIRKKGEVLELPRQLGTMVGLEGF